SRANGSLAPRQRRTPHATSPRSRLGPRLRVRAARAVPRGHVLRVLGLAREKPTGRPGARTLHAAELALALVPALPRVRRGHGPPARQGHPGLPAPAIVAPAAAAGR